MGKCANKDQGKPRRARGGGPPTLPPAAEVGAASSLGPPDQLMEVSVRHLRFSKLYHTNMYGLCKQDHTSPVYQGSCAMLITAKLSKKIAEYVWAERTSKVDVVLVGNIDDKAI